MDTVAKMNYGTEVVEIPVKGASSIYSILPNEMPEITDLKQAFLESVTVNVIGSAPLQEVIQKQDLVTIVVSDITRAWMHQDLILPMLVEFLHEKNQVPYEQIKIVIALGTHRKSTHQELVKICSQKVLDLVEVVDHDCDAPDLVLAGRTQRGTSVYVNPLVVGRKVIVVGGTVHHMMAGFGGGRKNILPGVAGRETIRMNHQRALDPVLPHTDTRVGCCKLQENPIHEDMAEAAELVPVVFSINLVVAASGIHSGIFSGDLKKAWKASCEFQKNCYEVPIETEADIVICSSNGYPKDMNLYQGCKGMLNAMRAVKPGGTMIWTCKCPEGGGAPDYFKWLEPLKEKRLEEALRADFTIGGYIFFLTCENLEKAECYMLTTLDPKLVQPMGLKADDRLEHILSQVDFTGKSVCLMPYAGSVIPVLNK